MDPLDTRRPLPAHGDLFQRFGVSISWMEVRGRSRQTLARPLRLTPALVYRAAVRAGRSGTRYW